MPPAGRSNCAKSNVPRRQRRRDVIGGVRELTLFLSTSSGMPEFPSIPYPPLEKLGLIGDRRTAALVAADGTLNWLCLPNYDGTPVFSALLDSRKGGGWKFGPRPRLLGRQRYASCAPILLTQWDEPDYSAELCDFMPWPHDDRKPADRGRRTVVRRLRCSRGGVLCRLLLRPCNDFCESLGAAQSSQYSATFDHMHARFFWSSKTIEVRGDRVEGEFVLKAGEEAWCVFSTHQDDWTAQSAATALAETDDYWRRWFETIHYDGPRRSGILRSVMLLHLLTFAPTGALIASPTCSLPERIGGHRNYDYRYSWIRDASLGLSFLAKLGKTEDAKRYLDWLVELESTSGKPLQVLYTIDGHPAPGAREREDVAGYRRSQPVRTGNAAAGMSEIDSYGYLADCLLTYLHHGGEWEPRYWDMVERIADFTARHWREPGSSIWELLPERQFLASKIMSAVALDRALAIAAKVGKDGGALSQWKSARDAILAEIMSRGWSERLQAFRQHYDADIVDASALLMPLLNVLPVEHPRVVSTVERLIECLDINGLLHRFIQGEADRADGWTLGDEEGAFLMCSFWLAQTFVQRNELERADAILQRAEHIAGDLGLFAESADARNNTLLGNMPLVFSQVEYARAALALDEAMRSGSGQGASRRA